MPSITGHRKSTIDKPSTNQERRAKKDQDQAIYSKQEPLLIIVTPPCESRGASEKKDEPQNDLSKSHCPINPLQSQAKENVSVKNNNGSFFKNNEAHLSINFVPKQHGAKIKPLPFSEWQEQKRIEREIEMQNYQENDTEEECINSEKLCCLVM